jgi:3,4-dihydroxy-2-butanone 4-phosphate synthase
MPRRHWLPPLLDKGMHVNLPTDRLVGLTTFRMPRWPRRATYKGEGMTEATPSTQEAPQDVARAVAQLRAGGFVIVFDSTTRENEGDLIIAAEYMTTKAMQTMLDLTSGVVCVSLPSQRAIELQLHQMVDNNTALHETAFTVSVDLKPGSTTGISAKERARTIRALAAPDTVPDDLARPGHVFPIRADAGGVLARPGHTEASSDLSTLAGLSGVTALCEIVLSDWSMARYGDLIEVSQRYSYPMLSVADLVSYRLRQHSDAMVIS